MIAREVWIGLIIPFIGTAAGSACVFFMKRELNINMQKALTGFAAGVMVAASVWSLIIPAMEQSAGMERLAFLPAFIGFWIGILFLLILDSIIPHLHLGADKAEGPVSHLNRTTMMVLAVALHNIPEGMAVGVVYAGYAISSQLCGGSYGLCGGGGIDSGDERRISLPYRCSDVCGGFHGDDGAGFGTGVSSRVL